MRSMREKKNIIWRFFKQSKLILPTRVRAHKKAPDSKRASNSKSSYHSWTNAWKTKFLYVIASRMLESTSFTSDSKRASDSKSLSILDLCLRNEVLSDSKQESDRTKCSDVRTTFVRIVLSEQCWQNSMVRAPFQIKQSQPCCALMRTT